jgi:hypothetical protein
MTSVEQNFDIYQGQRKVIEFTIYEEDDSATPENITGWSLEATFAPISTLRVDDSLTKTTTNGITITSGSDGEGEIVLPADETTEMDSGDWEWSLWLTDTDDEDALSIGTATVKETARSRSSTT